MAQWLRVLLSVLPGGPVDFPTPTTIDNYTSRWSDALLAPDMHVVHRQTYRQNAHAHKIKINKNFIKNKISS